MLAYDSYGPADAADAALVFLHGGMCNRRQFQHQITFFQGAYRCLTIDLPAHGESPVPVGPFSPRRFAEDVAATLQDAGISKAVVIGHSMGGQIAAELAASRPDLVGGVVFLDAPVEGVVGVKRAAAQQAARLLRDEPDARRYRRIAPSLVRPGAARSIIDRVAEDMSSLDPKICARILDEVILAYDGSAADAIRCPTLLVIGDMRLGVDVGADTRADHLRRCEELVRRFSHLSIGVVVRSGHFVMLEVPDQVNAMIAAYLAGLDD